MRPPPARFSVDRLSDPSFRSCALGSVLMTGRSVQARLPIPGMRRLGRYALVYVFEGRGSYVDASGCRGALAAGDLVLVFPDLPHVYGPSPCWSEEYVVFDGPIFRLWEQAGILDRSRPILRLGASTNWVERLRWISAAGVPTNEGAALRELVRLQEVLAEMLGRNPTWRQSARELWVEQARAALEHPGPMDRKLSSMAQAFCLSPSTFGRKFRQAVGMTPHQFRLQSLVRHAQVLMLEGELSDKQIARRLGFADASHFSRRFTRQVGVSPRAWRRRADLERSPPCPEIGAPG